jgi:hypothetical protein
MPQEASTCWNSTYEMLKFTYLYREAIDKITSDSAMELREYELLESEWETVEQHCIILKVRISLFFSFIVATILKMKIFKKYKSDLLVCSKDTSIVQWN